MKLAFSFEEVIFPELHTICSLASRPNPSDVEALTLSRRSSANSCQLSQTLTFIYRKMLGHEAHLAMNCDDEGRDSRSRASPRYILIVSSLRGLSLRSLRFVRPRLPPAPQGTLARGCAAALVRYPLAERASTLAEN